MRNSYFCTLFLVASLLCSCSRDVNTSATLQFDLSQISNPSANSVSAGFYPDLVIINIKYDGQNFFYKWECDYDDNLVFLCTLPSTISFGNKTFPAGGGRLIQALLVYSDVDDNLEFFYTDKTLAFIGGTMNVALGNQGWTKSASTGEGIVGGRIYRGATAAVDLTGPVEGHYQPANGAPKMKVIDEYIYAGWYDFMFLKSVPLSYSYKPTNEALFINKNFDSFVSLKNTTPTSKAVHLTMPSYQSYDYKTELISGGLLSLSSFNADFGYWGVGGTNLPGGLAGGTLLNNVSITDLFFMNILYSVDDDNTYIKSLGTGGNTIFTIDYGGVLEVNIDRVELIHKNTINNPVINIKNDINTTLGTNSFAAGVTSYQSLSISTPGYYDSTPEVRITLPNQPADNTRISDIKIYRKVFDLKTEPATEHIYGMYDLSSATFKANNAGDDGVGWSGTPVTLGEAIRNSFTVNYDSSIGTILNYSLLDYAGAYSGNFVGWTGAQCVTPANELCFPTVNSFPTNGQCTTGDMDTNCFNILPKNATHRSLMPNDGPFHLFDHSGSYAGVFVDNCGGSHCDIEALLVPGLTPSDYGYTLFKLPENIEFDDDETPCEELIAQATGTQEVDIGSHGQIVPLSMLSSGQLLACPYKKGSPKKYMQTISRVLMQ